MPIRRIGISFSVIKQDYEQLNLFVNQEKIKKERKLENTIGLLKNKLGKNSVLRGINLEEGATAQIRNTLIGGHHA